MCELKRALKGDFMETLRKGSTGSLVSMLQLALKRSGFYSGLLDGIFGNRTQSAVINFQSANRIRPDGVVGPVTWRLLEKYIKGYFRYTLRRGDTYWMLANKYGTTVEAIRLANPDINSDFLQIGQIINIPFGYNVVPTDIPYSSDLVRLVVEGLSVRYPFLQVSVIGKSVMGKDIYCIKQGRGVREIGYNAAHHANEWITVPVLLKFVEEYAFAYANDKAIDTKSAKQLYERTTLYTVPLVNPDGIDLATGSLQSGDYYDRARNISEHYPNIRFPQGWKANISGTDLNLNYPAEWERAMELKYAQGFVSPAPRDFVGTAPLSAPESRTMFDFTQSHSFKLILAYHTQGEIIYWKFMDYDPPRALEIGEEMSRVSGYPLEITPEFSSYAGYKDWFIQAYNLPGYTIEAGKGVNPLPISQFDKIYRDNIGILTTGLAEG